MSKILHCALTGAYDTKGDVYDISAFSAWLKTKNGRNAWMKENPSADTEQQKSALFVPCE